MGARTFPATAAHEDLRNALIEAVRKTAPDMQAEEILAVVCVFVGQLIAVQDQRRYSSDAIMDLVRFNIEAGNKRVIEDLFKAKGGNA